MRVFMSWSGERSKLVGELLDEWLQCVIQAIDPWMSTKDLDRGALWFTEINNQLKDVSVGIIVLTKENKEKPWILFEAGALAKGLSTSRVCIVLVDLKAAEVRDPLAQFNLTVPDRTGIWNLVSTLNSSLQENALKEKVLSQVFDTYWPQFERKLAGILDSTPEILGKETKVTTDDLIAELIDNTRNINMRLRNIERPRRIEDSKVKHRVMPAGEARRLIKSMYIDGMNEEEIIKALSDLVPYEWLRNSVEEQKLMIDMEKHKSDKEIG